MSFYLYSLILSVCYGHWGMYNVCLLPRKSKFQNLDLLTSLLLAWQLLLLCIWPEQDWALQWRTAVGDFRAHRLPHHSWGRPGPDPDLCFSCSSSCLSCNTQAKLLPPLILLGSRPHWRALFLSVIFLNRKRDTHFSVMGGWSSLDFIPAS